MSLYEAFEALRTEGAARGAGARALYHELRDVAQRLPLSTDRDELVHELMARWLGAPPENLGREVGRGYLARCLQNKDRDHIRKLRNRATRADPESAASIPTGLAGEPLTKFDEDLEVGIDSARIIAERLALIERVAEAVIERARPAERERRRATWADMKALYFEGRVTRDDLVAAEAKNEPAASEAALRNRFFQQHRRFREAFVETARALAREGALDAEDLKRAEAVCATVLTDRPRQGQKARPGTL